jgi:O-antigen biosynthesis protein
MSQKLDRVIRETEAARRNTDHLRWLADRLLEHPLSRPLRRLGRRRAEPAEVPEPEPDVRTPPRLPAERSNPRTSGPLVTVVVPTRRAGQVGATLSSMLSGTRYEDTEVVVVDNDSPDSPTAIALTGEKLAAVVRNTRNESFSRSCNQGAAAGSGRYLLFLNDDIEPLDPGWLGAMVDALESDPDIAAVGAHLVYGVPPDDGISRPEPFTTQHRGIAFHWRDGVPTGVNLGAGDDPGTAPPGVERVVAATAACLLVDREAFVEIGGFDETYVYGWEDIDLCLRLRQAGREVAVTNDALLVHAEFGTQGNLTSRHRQVKSARNRRTFIERWGPEVYRAMRSEGLGTAGPVRWLDRTPARAVMTLSSLDRNDGYGDWYTAHELGDAMTEAGWDVTYAERQNNGWYAIDEQVDLIISLLPQLDLDRVPRGPVKVAWVRNWPGRWLENPSLAGYDLALCATSEFAKAVELASAVTTELMPLATNPDRFSAGEWDISLAADYTFTGNAWGSARSLIDRLEVKPAERFTIFGRGWEGHRRAQRYALGPLDYELLPNVYASTPITLDDTVAPNRPALNARVFDALAAGSLPITDNRTGSEEWFEGRLPVAESRPELRAALDRYLGDERARSSLVAELSEVVRQRHTYRHRARQVTKSAGRVVAQPKLAIRIGPPKREVAEAWGDTHFARDFARAMRRQGWTTRIDLLPEWDDLTRMDADVVLHLRGLIPSVPVPGAVNVMWIISHPDDVTPAECERFDLVLVASEVHAAQLAGQVSVPVQAMLQATDPERFTPAAATERTHDLVFVGNSRGVDRRGVRWAVEAGLPIEIWGSGWEGPIADHVVAEMLPNKDLPALYASSKLVLCDHWPDMAQKGYISNRVFDALAAGATPLSDPVESLDSLVGEMVATYSDASSLEAAVIRLLASDAGALHRTRAPDHMEQFFFGRRAREFVGEIAQMSGTSTRWSAPAIPPHRADP